MTGGGSHHKTFDWQALGVEDMGAPIDGADAAEGYVAAAGGNGGATDRRPLVPGLGGLALEIAIDREIRRFEAGEIRDFMREDEGGDIAVGADELEGGDAEAGAGDSLTGTDFPVVDRKGPAPRQKFAGTDVYVRVGPDL